MISAEYRGIDGESLESGRVYKITTHCINNRLIVYANNSKRSYAGLEQFLKDWKVRAVYHDTSRKKKS